nr:spore protease YyaC [Paenibacillus tyrfis]
MAQTIPAHQPANKYVFFCVGTDRSTGDSLGPIVGTLLEEAGYQVIGTLDNPAHAENIRERINEIPPESIVVGIDACLGMLSSIGKIKVDYGPVKPGAGLGKELPPVGDYHIIGIVNIGGFMEYYVLQNTRLSLVMDMAKKIVTAIQTAIPICQGNKEVAAAIEPLSNQKTILEENKMKKSDGHCKKS